MFSLDHKISRMIQLFYGSMVDLDAHLQKVYSRSMDHALLLMEKLKSETILSLGIKELMQSTSRVLLVLDTQQLKENMITYRTIYLNQRIFSLHYRTSIRNSLMLRPMISTFQGNHMQEYMYHTCLGRFICLMKNKPFINYLLSTLRE